MLSKDQSSGWCQHQGFPPHVCHWTQIPKVWLEQPNCSHSASCSRGSPAHLEPSATPKAGGDHGALVLLSMEPGMCLKAYVCVCVSAMAAGLSACPCASAVSHCAAGTRASSTTTAIVTEVLSARWPKPVSHMPPGLPLHQWHFRDPDVCLSTVPPSPGYLWVCLSHVTPQEFSASSLLDSTGPCHRAVCPSVWACGSAAPVCCCDLLSPQGSPCSWPSVSHPCSWPSVLSVLVGLALAPAAFLSLLHPSHSGTGYLLELSSGGTKGVL